MPCLSNYVDMSIEEKSTGRSIITALTQELMALAGDGRASRV